MAESAMEVVINPTSNILTEEMIDAAMSQRLNMEIEVTECEKVDNDHDYCGDDKSSDSDYQVETICDDGEDDNSDKKMSEAVNKNIYNESVKCNNLEDKRIYENVYCKLGKKNEQQNSNESSDVTNTNSLPVNENIVGICKNIDFSNKSSNITTETNTNVSLTNTKQSLSIKPLSNLLKDNLIVKEDNVKMLKSIQGKIESQDVLEGNDKNKSTVKETAFSGENNVLYNSEPSNHIDSENNVNTSLFEELPGKMLLDNNVMTNYSNCNQLDHPGIKSNINVNSSVHELETNAEVRPPQPIIVTVESKNKIISNLLKKDHQINLMSPKVNNANDEKGKISVEVKEVPVLKTSANKDGLDPVNKPNNENVLNNSETNENADISLDKNIDENVPLPGLSLNIIGNRNNESNDSSAKVVTVKPGSKTFLQRRQILPKINFRYHTKDKLIVSDRLPNNNNNCSIPLAKKNSDYYILPDGSNAQSVIIMSPDMKTQTKNTLVKLKSPPPNNAHVKYLLNKVNVSTGEVHSMARTINTPHISTLKDKTGNTITPHIHLIKDKNCNTKTWEKVDRVTLSILESNSAKHEEMNLSSLKSQLLEREVPTYKPVDCNEYYSCLDCNDRFVLESSLRQHRFRKSVLIKYWCRTCSCCLNMYNRCMFLAHIRSHNQLVKNIDMSCLTIEPLPKSLIKLGLSEEDIDKTSSLSSPSSTSVVNTSHVSVNQSILVNGSNESVRSSTVTSVSKSAPINSIRNLTDVDHIEGKHCNSKLVQTTAKLVPSNIYNTKENIEKRCELLNNSDVPDDVKINGEVSDHPTSLLENNEIEITVSESTQDISENREITFTDVTVQNNDSVDVSKTEKQQPDQKSKVKPKGKRKCPECDMNISARGSLRKHLQKLNKPGDESLKCNVCRLILPTKCALKMHLRIHMKLKPFRCPECAIEFHIYDRFVMHLKYTCCHLTKCVRYVCTLCGNMQVSLAALEQHLLMRHVRSIFKCGYCPVAFVNAKAVEKHKEKAHPGLVITTNSYQQCRLCPEKLIPKKRFLAHMKTHVNDEKLCIYAFQCPTCKFTFFQRTELIYHRMKCDTRDGIIKSVIGSPPPRPQTHEVNVEETVIGDDGFNKNNDDDDEQEMIFPSRKRKLDNDEVEIIEDETDPLSLEGFQVLEESSREPKIEYCIVCKKEKVITLPGKNQSLCCNKCVSPCDIPKQLDSEKFSNETRSKLQAAKMKGYKCKICRTTNFMDLKTIYEHFKTYHKELEGQSINKWLIIDNNLQNNKRSSTITTAETIKEKYTKKKKPSPSNSQPISIKKEHDDEPKDQQTSLEKKKPKRCVKLKNKVSEIRSFESGQLIVSNDTEKPQLKCSKCDFVANEIEELRNHVVCHRTDPNALQCLECGECFVVLPSLEKHLIINHRISDVDTYIASNRKLIDGIQDSVEASDEAVKETEVYNSCKVCHEVFESKTALDKHFRSHGMAFLFKNMFQ